MVRCVCACLRRTACILSCLLICPCVSRYPHRFKANERDPRPEQLQHSVVPEHAPRRARDDQAANLPQNLRGRFGSGGEATDVPKAGEHRPQQPLSRLQVGCCEIQPELSSDIAPRRNCVN